VEVFENNWELLGEMQFCLEKLGISWRNYEILGESGSFLEDFELF